MVVFTFLVIQSVQVDRVHEKSVCFKLKSFVGSSKYMYIVLDRNIVIIGRLYNYGLVLGMVSIELFTLFMSCIIYCKDHRDRLYIYVSVFDSVQSCFCICQIFHLHVRQVVYRYMKMLFLLI